MARPITLAGLVFILMSISSAHCLAVQSDTDPVFPKTLQGALVNEKAELSRFIPNKTDQKQRRRSSGNQPLSSVLINKNTRQGSSKAGANQLVTPAATAQSSLAPRLAELPKEQLPLNRPTLVEPTNDLFQERANQRAGAEADSVVDESSITSIGEVHNDGESGGSNTALAASESDSEGGFGTVMTFPDGDSCASAQIVVHPPESIEDNEFSFSVQNIGNVQSEPFFVEFETPSDVSIMQVFPFDAKATRTKVVIPFEGLDSGSQSPVHIKTTASVHGKFSFKTRIRMEKVHAYEVKTGEPTFPQISGPNENTPFRFASTGSFDSGTTHRLTDSPETNGALLSAQMNSDNKQRSRPNVALATSLTGSEVLVEGREHEFEIVVKNQSPELATEVVIQLAMPSGLMITKLDREAWIDQQKRTVSWKVDSIVAGQTEKIVYRVKALSHEEQYQKIVVGMSNAYQGEVDFASKVIVAQHLERAPRPEFEH